jgi:hypothetical protein
VVAHAEEDDRIGLRGTRPVDAGHGAEHRDDRRSGTLQSFRESCANAVFQPAKENLNSGDVKLCE